MSNQLIIKNKIISNGKLSICVPIVATTREEIISNIKKYIKEGISFIELRMDFFEGIRDEKKLKDLLAEISKYCDDTVLLFTIRSKKEGGNIEIPEEELFEIFDLASSSGHIDLVDIEALSLNNPTKFVQMLHKNGVKIIGSHHCFDRTYLDDELDKTFDEIYKIGVDIVKVAMMPENNCDALRTMMALDRFNKTHDRLSIAISMGKYGKLSRIFGGQFGSCLTFASLDKASAPGQVSFKDMVKILDLIED